MSTKKRLGELLLESGIIDEAMLQSALGHQRRWGGRLGQALLDLKLVSEAVIVDALARKSGIEVARLDELEPYALEQAMKLVPREFAQRNNIFPMSADTSTVTVAMSDPTNLALTDELRFRTGRRVKVCIAGDRQIAEAIRFHFPQEYQAPASIALDIESTGSDGLPLAEPFEGGSTEDMRAMLEPTRHAAAKPAPAPAPTRPYQPAAPPVASATPQLARPAVQPPAPPVASVAPALQPARPAAPAAAPAVVARPAAPTAPPGTVRAVSAPSQTASTRTAPPGTVRAVPAPAVPRPAATPMSGPGHAPTVTRSLPTATPVPTAPRPSAAGAAQPAGDAMLGAIPRGGFAPEEPYEELTPSPVDEAEPISADLLAPEEEMVEGRVPIRELSPRDVAILDALDQLARGVEDPASPLKPGRVAATLLRLLLKKKLVGEAELLDELSRR